MHNLIIPFRKNDHYQGNPKAPVILVEYGDFECPNCGDAYPIIKSIQKHLGNRLLFIFRYFPLSRIHPHAKQAAYSVEAASLQGKFWQMHDILFENQHALAKVDLMNYSIKLKINIDRFEKDMMSQSVKQKVRDDFIGGVRSGVNGTPTFYINGARHNGSYEYDDLLAAIESEVKYQYL